MRTVLVVDLDDAELSSIVELRRRLEDLPVERTWTISGTLAHVIVDLAEGGSG
jgi:hypothetical protein